MRALPLAALAAALFLPALGARDLWHPNEPTYAQAVAEMAAAGEWLIPTVNGLPFAEKPILYFWLARLFSLALGGVTELTLRLPSALAAIALVVMLERLVARYTDRGRARVAALVLLTSYIVFWSARSIQMDVLLAACTLGAVAAVAGVLDHGVAARRGYALAGLAAGLGVLAKGPVGIVCPALAIGTYALATRRARALLQPAALWGALALVAVAGPWYLALAARGESAFLSELLYRQNVERFFRPWDHDAPWWYFAEAFVLDMLPWSPFLVLAWRLPPEGERERRLDRLAWAWFLAILVFFSLSASKRSPYILPAAPAAAILLSGPLDRWRRGRLDPTRRRLARSILALQAAALVGASVAAATGLAGRLAEPPELWRAGLAASVLAGAGGLAILAGAASRRSGGFAGVWALLLFVVASYATAAVAVLPGLDAIKSHRPFCDAIVEHVGPREPLHGYRLWTWRAAYSYYSGRRIPSLASASELEEYWARPERVFLIVERGMLDELRATVDPGPPLAERAVGSNRVYLFANR